MSRRLVILGLALGALVARPAAAVTIEKVVSPGGIEAWLVEDHGQKVISLSYAFHTGGAEDAADKDGLTEFVASTLDEGAGALDSEAYQGKLEDLSSSITFEPSQDYFEGTVRTVSPHRDEVFDLLRLALTQPRFDAPAVARVRDEITKAIAARAEEPNALAGKIWWRTNFPNEAYGRPLLGTAKTVDGITIDDLKAYVQTRFGRNQLKLAVVGDLTPDELKPLLDKTFGTLPASVTEPAAPADAAPVDGGKLLLVKKSVPQSIILFGQPGLPIADKDYYTFLVLNNVLGGGTFSTRLEHAVREEKGLAYSIGTGLSNYDHAALMFGQAGTHPPGMGALRRRRSDRQGIEGRQDLPGRRLCARARFDAVDRRAAAVLPDPRPADRLFRQAQGADRKGHAGRRQARRQGGDRSGQARLRRGRRSRGRDAGPGRRSGRLSPSTRVG